MPKPAYYLINGITIYRIAVAPFLLVLIFTDRFELFKWLLAASFFTDLIDGFLARLFKVTSIGGSRLDSIGDDLTVLAAIIGLIVFEPGFLKEELPLILFLLALFVIQNAVALIRYGKLTSFHTYIAKMAAVLQGMFLLLMFWLHDPFYPLFYAAIAVTALDLLEEIILVALLPKWEADVKGIYWVQKRKKQNS